MIPGFGEVVKDMDCWLGLLTSAIPAAERHGERHGEAVQPVLQLSLPGLPRILLQVSRLPKHS